MFRFIARTRLVSMVLAAVVFAGVGALAATSAEAGHYGGYGKSTPGYGYAPKGYGQNPAYGSKTGFSGYVRKPSFGRGYQPRPRCW